MSRTAIVTGGASGIGRAIAERLRRDGIVVLTIDRDESADLVADVSDAEALETALARTEDTAGGIDIAVNCAGIVGPQAPLWEVSGSDWDMTFAVNVRGVFNVCKSVVPGMVERGWGRIVNMASIAGKDGTPNLSAYSASKAAVIALTKSIGKELARTGVIVKRHRAGRHRDTDECGHSTRGSGVHDESDSDGPSRSAQEVAELAVWLASDACSFSTGAVYDISGGRATY